MDFKNTLDELRSFVQLEHQANLERLRETWSKPLAKKLLSGDTQRIARIKAIDKNHLELTLGDNESRFREGDMVCLHTGDAENSTFIRQATIDAEHDGEWLLRIYNQGLDVNLYAGSELYADADAMDLKVFFDKALDDIAESRRGREIILPLLAGVLDTGHIYPDTYDNAADAAEAAGLNEQQIDAVGKGVASRYVACIQGPPGTGKTKVISLIARLLVEEGQCVLLTSHTHMAINNALNKIHREGVPVVKVGSASSVRSLDSAIKRFDYGDDWHDRPDTGYVIGATPFATCTERLQNFAFDTVIFDEASQITVPLAIMAMRKAKRFVFVGDHKQLPPVVLSKSVLHTDCYSVFAALITQHPATSVMLRETYRMNEQLTHWPSKQYYGGELVSASASASRQFSLPRELHQHAEILSGDTAFVFVKSPASSMRTSNLPEAKFIADIIVAAIEAGLPVNEVGVVTPFRAQGKTIRNLLASRLGASASKKIVTDTVDRMQGQEREMIIVSMSATDRQFLNAIAPFFFQDERLNVAITRPKTKLILIGPELPADFAASIAGKGARDRVEAYRSLVSSAHICTMGAE